MAENKFSSDVPLPANALLHCWDPPAGLSNISYDHTCIWSHVKIFHPTI